MHRVSGLWLRSAGWAALSCSAGASGRRRRGGRGPGFLAGRSTTCRVSCAPNASRSS